MREIINSLLQSRLTMTGESELNGVSENDHHWTQRWLIEIEVAVSGFPRRTANALTASGERTT